MEMKPLIELVASVKTENVIKTEIPMKIEAYSPEDLEFKHSSVGPIIKIEQKEEVEGPITDDKPDIKDIKRQTEPPIATCQVACIPPNGEFKVKGEDHFQNNRDPKPIKDEKWGFPVLESKPILIVPIVKIERNWEIEEAIKEVATALKKKYHIPGVKLECDLPIASLAQAKKEHEEKFKPETIEGNRKFNENDDEHVFTDMDCESMDFNNENDSYSKPMWEIPCCTLFVCPKCSQCYRSKTLLENHLCPKIGYNSNDRYKKGSNSNAVPAKETMARRVSTKDKKGAWCNKCQRGFCEKKYLKKHLLICKGKENRFECVLCSQNFKDKVELKAHTQVHKKEKRYTCSDCGERFSRRSTLVLHSRRHTDAFPFRCEECGKGFQQTAHLKVHMYSHTKESPYKCDQCSRAFKRPNSLKTHQRRHTGETPFKCKECGKGFISNVILKMHLKIHSKVKPHKCDVCNKCFSRLEHLKTHLRTHTGEKPYKCSDCGKSFSQSSALNVHKRVHSNVRPFKCSECGVRFKDSSSLLVHRRSHLNLKPFKCEECGKCFSQNSNYHAHKRSMHMGSKPNTCDVCGKTFALKGSLVQHLKLWHVDKEFICGICKESIKSRYHFHHHVQKHIDLL